jgi:hypothetical protein
VTAQNQFGQSPAKTAVLAIRFGTELALLAVLVILGLNAGIGLAGRVVLAVGGPVVAAVLWGVAIAPQARRRLADPLRIAIEVVLFGAAAVGLGIEGSVIGAVIFSVVTIGVAALVRVVAPGG